MGFVIGVLVVLYLIANRLRYRNVFVVPTTMILFVQGTKIHWVRCSKTL